MKRSIMCAAALLAVIGAGYAEPVTLAVPATEGPEWRLAPVFQKTEAGWQAVNCDWAACTEFYDQEWTWHLWLDRKDLGTMVSRGSACCEGKLKVVRSTIPADNSTQAILGTDSIALTRVPGTAAPEWIEGYEKEPQLAKVWPLIRKVAPKVGICTDHNEKPSRKSRIGDVALNRAWQSSNGDGLFLYQVMDSHYGCDGPPIEQEDVLIHVGPDGAMRLLPGLYACRGAEIFPEHFGDFDGDGKDEILISYSAMDCGGRLLYYDGLSKFVRNGS